MRRRGLLMMIGVAAIAAAAPGCMSRMIREGLGAARGASGRVTVLRPAEDLTRYKGLRVQPVGVTPGLELPEEMPGLIVAALEEVASDRDVPGDAAPAMQLTAEVIHYDAGSSVDKAIGPLSELLLRAQLLDGETRAVLSEANLASRSKATTSSGEEDMAEGVGKALDKWLEEVGFGKSKEEKSEED